MSRASDRARSRQYCTRSAEPDRSSRAATRAAGQRQQRSAQVRTLSFWVPIVVCGMPCRSRMTAVCSRCARGRPSRATGRRPGARGLYAAPAPCDAARAVDVLGCRSAPEARVRSRAPRRLSARRAWLSRSSRTMYNARNRPARRAAACAVDVLTCCSAPCTISSVRARWCLCASWTSVLTLVYVLLGP